MTFSCVSCLITSSTMIYSQKQKTDGRRRAVVLRLVVVGLVLAGMAGGTILVLHALDVAPVGLRRRNTELLRLWNDERYQDVLRLAKSTLETDPFDAEALTFGGFAHFYVGLNLAERDDQLEHLRSAIILLRRALHVPHAPLAAERDYVLAKAYFHRGDEYVDLTVSYMERALERGYDAPDSRTYLALALAILGDHEQSIVWFEEALVHADRADRNAIRIRAADSYVELERYAEARDTLLRAIDELEDDFLVLIARNKLASVYIADEQWSEAETLLDETIERFPRSADAYYYLGIVYEVTDRGVQARNLWRTARDIDPDHTEALMRLANWGR